MNINDIYKIEYNDNLLLDEQQPNNTVLKKQLVRERNGREKLYTPLYRRTDFVRISTMVLVVLIVAGTVISIVYNNHKQRMKIRETTINVIILGEAIDAAKDTVTIDERTYFVLDRLCGELGYEIINEGEYIDVVIDNKKYRISNNSLDVKIISSETGKTESKVTLSQRPFIYDGKLYVYIRDLSLFLPIATVWDNETQTVFVNKI